MDGFLKRASSDLQLDLHADYTFKFGARDQRIVVLADVFNVLNRQAAINYDNYTEQSFGTLNPNFGLPLNGGGTSRPGYQPPLGLRLGARFEF